MRYNELKVKVLEYLQEHSATAGEISQALGITHNLALTVLKRYMQNGLVKRKRIRQGRSRYCYSITKRGIERLMHLREKNKVKGKV